MERDRLHEMLQELETEKQRLIGQVETLEEVVKSGREEKDNLKQEYEEKVQGLEAKNRGLEDELMEAREEIETLEKSQARFKAEFEDLTAESNSNRERVCIAPPPTPLAAQFNAAACDVPSGNSSRESLGGHETAKR